MGSCLSVFTSVCSEWLPHLDRSGWTEGLWVDMKCGVFREDLIGTVLVDLWNSMNSSLKIFPLPGMNPFPFPPPVLGDNVDISDLFLSYLVWMPKKWKYCRAKRKSPQNRFPGGGLVENNGWIQKDNSPKMTSHLFCTDHRRLWSNSPHLQKQLPRPRVSWELWTVCKIR